MSVKLFAFLFMIYVVIALLVYTYEYSDTSADAGVAYTTGTATFTYNSTSVEGSGTSWDDTTMAGGLIRLDADDIWCKIESVEDADSLTLADPYTGDGGSGAYTMAVSMAWWGYESSDDLSPAMRYKSGQQQLPVLGEIPEPVPDPSIFSTLLKVATLQVSFLDQPGYQIVQYFLYGFALMGVLSALLLFYSIIRGNVTWGTLCKVERLRKLGFDKEKKRVVVEKVAYAGEPLGNFPDWVARPLGVLPSDVQHWALDSCKIKIARLYKYDGLYRKRLFRKPIIKLDDRLDHREEIIQLFVPLHEIAHGWLEFTGEKNSEDKADALAKKWLCDKIGDN